jgi:hypothetical protein
MGIDEIRKGGKPATGVDVIGVATFDRERRGWASAPDQCHAMAGAMADEEFARKSQTGAFCR